MESIKKKRNTAQDRKTVSESSGVSEGEKKLT